MSTHYPRIRIHKKTKTPGIVGIREALSLTFYMTRVHQEVVQDVLRAVDVYRQSLKADALGWYVEPYSEEWEPLDAKGQSYMWGEMSRHPAMGMWLSGLPNSVTGYDILYEGCLYEGCLSEPHALDRSNAVSFRLPTEELEARGPEWVRDLALRLARELPYASGYAGLCFNFPESVVGYTDVLRTLAFRYPGLDVPEPHWDASTLGTRLKGVHWMNFLGPTVLGPLGGVDGLRARLHTPGTTVEALEGGRAVVTLGPWPEAGDLDEGRDLPAWRELARVLEPWLYQPRGEWSGFSAEDMRRWARRFLD